MTRRERQADRFPLNQQFTLSRDCRRLLAQNLSREIKYRFVGRLKEFGENILTDGFYEKPEKFNRLN